MASLISIATGNWTAAGSWGLVDSTSLLDSEANNTALTTSYVESASFTPGAITIDGIAVKLASRATGSPSNTISIRLAQAGSTVAGTEVTIDVADINACGTTQNEGGWYLFKFTGVLLVAATAYTVSAKLSSTSTAVNLYRNSTAGNWSRMLRTTTTQAPAAADILHVIGEHTGAGAGNNFTVTMNETATTDYGSGTDDTTCLTIGKRGTLTYGITASTNYYLKLSGDLIVYSGGQFNMGTTGTPMPSTSSAVLEFDPTSDGGKGFYARNGSAVVVQGNALSYTWDLLASDVAASATSMTSVNSTGWKSGNTICITPTRRNQSHRETKAMSGDASGTSIPIAALTNAHDGGNGGPGSISDAAAIGCLDRNVKIRSATSTIGTYMRFAPTATLDMDYAEIYYTGHSFNTGKTAAITLHTTTGSINIQGCSFHDEENHGISMPDSGVANVSITNNVIYNWGTSSSGSGIYVVTSSGASSVTISNNLVFAGGGSVPTGISISSVDGVISGNYVANCYYGININSGGGNDIGTFNNNTTVCCSSAGLYFGGTSVSGIISNHNSWRNPSAPGISGTVSGMAGNELLFDSCNFFGNGTSFVGNCTVRFSAVTIRFKNCLFTAEASYDSQYMVAIADLIGAVVIYDNCSFSTVANPGTSNFYAAGGSDAVEAIFINCAIGGGSLITATDMDQKSILKFHKYNQTAGDFRTYAKRGSWLSEVTTRHTASGYSWKGTPSSATYKLIFPGPTIRDTFKVACPASVARTITAWVQKDGSYNGNAPRLVLVGGMVAGIASDVTDSLTVGASTWEQLSVTGTPSEAGVLEYYVDCDGTAGNIYVDDLAVT